MFDKIIDTGHEDTDGYHHDESPFMDDMRRQESRDFSAAVVMWCMVGAGLVVGLVVGDIIIRAVIDALSV